MNNKFTVGDKVYVLTPSHGYVSSVIKEIKKDNNKINYISVSYEDNFIKETYGDDDIIYTNNNIDKILTKNEFGERPFYWVSQNRKDFPDWVTNTFMKYSSCDENNKNKKNGFNYLPHQKFIRDYLGHKSPYRGLLLYHGLGTGKTCASIAVSENLKDTRNIIVLLPATGLKDNFKLKGLKVCGNKDYKKEDGNKLIDEKYTLITYKSSYFVKQLEDLGSLNNKVIIVDEAHNLATLMANGIRGMGKQGAEIYKMLYNAKNTKFIFLTGTPLVNTPFEIAVLFNILRGPLEVIVFKVNNFSENTINNYIVSLLSDERIAWVELNRRNKSLLVILKLNSWDMEFEQTVRFIETKGKDYDASIIFETTIKSPLFRDNEEDFNDFFVKDDTFINKDMFQRRIVGLTSYFETPKNLMKEFPELLPNKIVRIEMSNHQFEIYTKAREVEKQKERQAAGKYKKAKYEKVTTLARVFSREFSNFVFPDEIIRPFKKMRFLSNTLEKKKKEEEEIKNIENIEDKEEQLNKETLSKKIIDSLNKLSNPEKKYLIPGPNGLSKYSPKMEEMLKEINKEEKGLILVYSSFRNVEGLEIFARILERNGYFRFNNDLSDNKMDYKRFAFYSGNEDRKTRQQAVDVYTNSLNKYGKDLRILLISSTGAEGLDLKNIKKVLIMDVFWHDVRLQQIIGRAVRKKSHYDLPEDERKVQPIIYLSVFTKKQEELTKEKISTDEYIYNISKRKLRLNNYFLTAIKETAIDCMLNQCENRDKCFKFVGNKNKLAYIPKIEDDIIYGYRNSKSKDLEKKIVVSGLSTNNEIIYKKDKEWFLGNGKKLNKKPDIIKNKKYGLDLNNLELFDYKQIKEKGSLLKIGEVDKETSKIIPFKNKKF